MYVREVCVDVMAQWWSGGVVAWWWCGGVVVWWCGGVVVWWCGVELRVGGVFGVVLAPGGCVVYVCNLSTSLTHKTLPPSCGIIVLNSVKRIKRNCI
jgi:hypothetical protein